MIIDCISDLHGHYPDLEGGDLLIVAGDIGEDNSLVYKFVDWIRDAKYKKKIVIAGNHDNYIGRVREKDWDYLGATYLFDSGTEFEGLKIWGSPWTKSFYGMNPKCRAFTCQTDMELKQKWDLIPTDVDILVTHCPPLGFMDEVENYNTGKIEYVGSYFLHKILYQEKIKPFLHVFGHVHGGYGQCKPLDMPGLTMINASHVNELYEPVNKPIRYIL